MNFSSKELLNDFEWRGLISSASGNISELLNRKATFYLGIDPTSIPDNALNGEHKEITTSLHVGHLLALVTVKRLQMYGHQPILVIGKSTCSVGDLAGKSNERELIDYDRINQNAKCLEEQIRKLIDFDSSSENKAILVDNSSWMKDMTLIEYARNFGKLIPINFMLAKDSVKSRLEKGGLSLCEFLYSTLQGIDFYHLYKEYNCVGQIGGDEQQGSMSYGSMLIHKLLGSDKDTFTITWPLITKSDGTKFGKSENGCIYLNKYLTTPYEFYQFWLNQTDEDAKRFIKMFTFLSREEIEALIDEHDKKPHLRILQKRLAKEVTIFVHSEEDYNVAVESSNILFGNATKETLNKLDDSTFMAVFNGVPKFEVDKQSFDGFGMLISTLLTEKASVFKSKGELSRLIKGGGLSINKEKVSENISIHKSELINDKFLLVQQGKKNYSLIIAK